MESNLIKLEKDFTLQLEQLQNQIASLNLEGVYVGTDSEEIAPLKHTFAEGLPIKQMDDRKKEWNDVVKDSPTLYEYLKKEIY